jgi:hypothetical protein
MSQFFLVSLLMLSSNLYAGTFVPYNIFSKVAFVIGEGASDTEARTDAVLAIPKNFQKSDFSAMTECQSAPKKFCRLYIPVEPKDIKELVDYKDRLERLEAHTQFVGYGDSVESAKKDLFLKTGKKSLSIFSSFSINCPVGYNGKLEEKCVNHDAKLKNVEVIASLPRSCYATE